MIRVMANGCFDCLHIGHIMHLQAAKALGDVLIVALTLDAHVNKGIGRPVFSYAERRDALLALRCVDEVVPSYSAVYAIAMVRPDIFVKGYEYEGRLIDEDCVVRDCGGKLQLIETPTYSSTKILTGELLRERIAAAGQGGR